MTVMGVAAGIHAVVNENMAAATRILIAEKGRDPRRYTLLAFGGAGPVHAYGLAMLRKLPRILVPAGARVASALGCLAAAPAIELARGGIRRLSAGEFAKVEGQFAAMEAEARELLEEPASRPGMSPSAAPRTCASWGRASTSRCPCRRRHRAVQVAFLDADQRLLGRRIEGLPSEVLAWRLHATASRPGTLGGRLDGQALKGLREVWFPQTVLASCEVHDRCRLRPGLTLRGPAVVEERGSTTVIGPDASFKLDAQGSIVIGLDQGSRFRCPRPPPFVWMDGDLVPWERATLHVASECVLRDGNVLGGICAYWSGSEQDLLLVRHAGHVARRRQGARIMHMTIPYTDAAIAAASLALIRACGYRGAPVHDRPVAYLDIGGLTDNRPEEIRTGFFILAFSKPTTKAVTEGVRSNVSTWGRNADLASPSRAKAGSNDHHSRLACIEARLSGFQIPILLNQAGRVAEGPGACFMIVRKGTLITPPVTPTSSRASPGRG